MIWQRMGTALSCFTRVRTLPTSEAVLVIALVLSLTGCSGDWSDDGVTEVAEPLGPPRVEHDLTESSRFDASFDCAKASTPRLRNCTIEPAAGKSIFTGSLMFALTLTS